MPFEKGESGNPAGRPRGSRNRTALLMENLLSYEAEAIGRKAVEMAIKGDMAAIRLCMDRLAPARKEEPIAFELPPLEKPADSVAAAATLVAAVAEGELTPWRPRSSPRSSRSTCARSRRKSSMNASPVWRRRWRRRTNDARHRTCACKLAIQTGGCRNEQPLFRDCSLQ
jgi:hypothetical protein